MPMLFPRFDKLLTTKNTNATFFLVGGSIYITTNYRKINLTTEKNSTTDISLQRKIVNSFAEN